MSDLLERVGTIESEGTQAIEEAETLDQLDQVRVELLGKDGRLTAVLRQLGSLPKSERPRVGRRANELRDHLRERLQKRREELTAARQQRRLQEQYIDITLPGRQCVVGRPHPIRLITGEILRIFHGMGFRSVRGPEVEWDYYNFEALNIPSSHPARMMHDSFYLDERRLLRTHTSPMQIRYMESRAPQLPVKIVVPGKVYRRDDDATHAPMFHQVEGLMVDRGIRLSDLKGVLQAFVRRLFGQQTDTRLRPSYFPFTEPSVELDASCTICGGDGCRTCGDSGWVEMLGAGLVHPVVLDNGGYDPAQVSGFAFGLGLERLAMMKYGVDDLRLFTRNDMRFLRQGGVR